MSATAGIQPHNEKPAAVWSSGAALAGRISQLERGARIAQGTAAILIMVIGIYTIATLSR